MSDVNREVRAMRPGRSTTSLAAAIVLALACGSANAQGTASDTKTGGGSTASDTRSGGPAARPGGNMTGGVTATESSRSAGSTQGGERRTAKNNPDSRRDWERTHRVSKMIGTDVRDPQGRKIGDIKDIVLDDNGDVAYAVLAFGGIMGMGDKYFAVPWTAFQMPAQQNHFVLAVDQNQLKNAKGFDKNRWPDMADARWNEENSRAFGQTWRGGGNDAPSSAGASSGSGTSGGAGSPASTPSGK